MLVGTGDADFCADCRYCAYRPCSALRSAFQAPACSHTRSLRSTATTPGATRQAHTGAGVASARGGCCSQQEALHASILVRQRTR